MKMLELKIPPVAVFLLFGAGMWFVSRVAPKLSFSVRGGWVVAFSSAGLGLMVGLAGVVAFRSARTTVDPRFPERSSAVVVDGVYRWSRNPMYLGLLCVLFGWAVYLGHLLSLACLPFFVLYMNRFQIRPEERAMHVKFGDEYRSYSQTVRRWI